MTLSVDRTPGGQYQASINLLDDRGAGKGCRVFGPSYAGNSAPVFDARLDASTREEIRSYLDEVDPRPLPTLEQIETEVGDALFEISFRDLPGEQVARVIAHAVTALIGRCSK